ncbi:MAG TPA: LysM peptidoglycan-binding domain-containing protein [Thermoanaerobaculia bacterium]|nr:LysM peptidoglycan-binding domain-containing protein [Thermoanaerobaculia bacterium]
MASRKAEVAAPPPDPPAVSKAREEFSRGREAALSGDFQCASEAFARAVDSVRPVGEDAPADPAMIAFSTELYEGILRYEAMAPPVEAEALELAARTPMLAPAQPPDTTPDELLKARQAVSTDNATLTYDIPIVVNDAVLRILAVYQNDLHDVIARGLARSGRFIPMIERVFQEEGLPKDLAQVAMVESSFIPRARSPKAACGIWQFIPETGRHYGLNFNAAIDERNDPEKATRAAARYLRFLYDLFHDWYLAMAAYNAGEGKIVRTMEKTGLTDFWQLAASGLVKPQTQNYVPAVIASTLIAKNPTHYGFEVEYEKPLSYETLPLDRPVSLRHLAADNGATLEELQRLNPELRSEITPSGPGGYELKVPVGSREAVLVAFAEAPTAKPPSFRRHVVKRGETLASIARQSHVTLARLASANSLEPNARLSRGRVVLVPRPEPPVRLASNSRKSGRAQAAKQAKPPASTLEARHYKVQGGDTLYRIALKHGTTVAQLLAFNSLPGPALIKPGDTLKIPAKAR